MKVTQYPRKGQILHCTRCDEPIAEFLVDAQLGTPIYTPATTKMIREEPYRPGEAISCHKCGEYPIDPRNFR